MVHYTELVKDHTYTLDNDNLGYYLGRRSENLLIFGTKPSSMSKWTDIIIHTLNEGDDFEETDVTDTEFSEDDVTDEFSDAETDEEMFGGKKANKHFNYHNKEIVKRKGGKKTIRKVVIHQGKGYKTVSKFMRGIHQGTVKKVLSPLQVGMIRLGKFIPGLFSDCQVYKNKTKRFSFMKKGGKSRKHRK